MSLETVKSSLERFSGFEVLPNGLRMNTHCVYPSNAVVRVLVFGAGDTFFVTDEGRAFREAIAAGATLDYKDKSFAKMTKSLGLAMDRGVIKSPTVTADGLAGAIITVANASKEVAEWIYEHWRLERPRKFKDVLKELLRAEFKQIERREFLGRSNKPHTFEAVVQFMNGSQLLVDAVSKDANSINARVVANLDVKAADHPNLIQRIVYDDDEDWRADDLTLLQMSGVTLVAFSKSESVLKRIAMEQM